MNVNLGDEVEDTITGFRGIAIGRHMFLNGTTSITVQPIMEQYGYLSDTENFAEAALKVIKAKGGHKRGPIIVTKLGKEDV